MRRKVIRQRDSFTLTLPKSWATQLKLKSGDEVLVEQQDMNLVVSGEMALPEKKRITLDVSNYDRASLHLHMKSLYENGIYEIKLNFSDKDIPDYKRKQVNKISKMIPEFVEKFEGLAIVSQSSNFYVVRDISSSSQDAFDSIHRRIFFLLLEFQEEVCIALKNSNFNEIKKSREIDYNIEKFVSFCLRLLNQRTTPRFNLFYVINSLKLISTYTRHLSEAIVSQKALTIEGIKMIESVAAYFRNFYEFFYSPSLNKMQDLIRTRLEIREGTKMMKGKEANYISSFAEQVTGVVMSCIKSVIALNPGKIG